MRLNFPRYAVLAFLLASTSSAHAAVSASQWQSQLQAEMKKITVTASRVEAHGTVQVQEEGDRLVAHLPELIVTEPDKSYWSLPSITLETDKNSGSVGTVTVKLPEAITHRNSLKQETGQISLPQQDIAGKWSFSGNYFQSLTGKFQNATFTEGMNTARVSVSNLTLNTSATSGIGVMAKGVTSTTQSPKGNINGTIATMAMNYTFQDGAPLTLTRLIGVLNPVWLMAEGKPFMLETNVTKLAVTDTQQRAHTMDAMTSKLRVSFLSGKANATADVTASNVTQAPKTLYTMFLPKTLNMNATLTRLPVELLSFAPGQTFEAAKTAMADAGSRMDIKQLSIKTLNDTAIQGDGWLKATTGVPTGFVGRLNLNLEDLQGLIATVQKQLLLPGSDVALNSQTLLLLMAIQGAGKQNGKMTEFTVDMTSDGQVLVNGQDFSGLMGRKGKAAPAGNPI